MISVGKYKNVFLRGLAVFLMCLVLSPVGVEAKSFTSNFIKISDKTYSYKDDEISISDVRFYKSESYSDGTKDCGTLFGRMVNLTSEKLNVAMEISYYDEDYNLLATSTKNETPGKLNDMYQMNVILREDDFIDKSKTEGIAYFKIKYYSNTGGDGSPATITGASSRKLSESGIYGHMDYVIDKYNVEIVLNEDNTMDVTENITAYFNVSKHGIYRTLPLRNEVKRLDGTSSKNKVQITNLSVKGDHGSNYSISREGGMQKIKIGSADVTLRGEENYQIKYTYNLGKDPLKNADEFYYNIIGTGWDTVIGGVSYSITMPKEFDASKLGIAAGTFGSTSGDKIYYDVDGKRIVGSYDGVIQPGEALTVRVELPEGYFVGAGFKFNLRDYLPYLIPIVFLIVSLLLWYMFGRDDPVIETVEFYPPEGFNSLDVGFMFKGRAENKDVTSLIVYLANKGYIKITEQGTGKKGFRITKLKDYDGTNDNEKLFLEGLFEHNPTEVGFDDLYDRFYKTMNKILLKANSRANKNKIFVKGATSKIFFVGVMILISYFAISAPPLIVYGDPSLIMIAVMFLGFMFTFLSVIAIEEMNPNSSHSSSSKRTSIAIVIIIFAIFFGVPWFSIMYPALSLDAIYFVGYFVGLACIFGMHVAIKYLPRRTKYGNEILGKLRGFKNFLETVEKDKLETLVTQDPQYFYNILPFTYVLNVSDKWIKKFESIAMQAPDWYVGTSTDFDVWRFSRFMNATMNSTERAMSSSPASSSSSGGGFSGGGFSGGGSGGGGGGSW